MFVDGGRVPPGTLEVRRAALIINYTPKTERDITQRELELEIGQELENVPDIRYWFLDENGLRAISLVVTGADSNIVSNVASELATQMKRIPLIANVISETSLDRPELRIQPRADLAARLGVSTESLSQTIRVATIGDVGPALAKFDAGDRLVPIRVQLEDGARGDLPHARAVAGAARASTARRAACRSRSSPTSSSIRARPASTATTGSGRPRSRPTSSAPRRSAMRPRRSTSCR